MRIRDRIAGACAYCGATSSSFGRVLFWCAASLATNFSMQDRSCCTVCVSRSFLSRCRESCLLLRTSSSLSTRMPIPVCCAPLAGNMSCSSLALSTLGDAPAADRSSASKSPPRSAVIPTELALSCSRSHVSSTAARRLPARSKNRPETEAVSSTFCWMDKDSSFNFCLVSCFFCWWACHLTSLSFRCSSQALSTCASTLLLYSLAWWSNSCCSAWLCDRSACSHSCFTLVSLSSTSLRRRSSQTLVWAFSAS
mmetsp:Transcript_48167/g.121354  ORF Transcript_48167/g.121354 Transcript_48167/m.121354 type:complete len:253 (-) Transcript_48167:182-940(-)